MNETRKQLIEALKKTLATFGVANSDGKSGVMLAYMRLVLERNKVVNLTSILDEEEFLSKHLLDSLSCLGRSEVGGAEKIIDVGTGAGFPGVPLAVCYPEKEFLLIDSLGKRTNFITEACASLGIGNVRALHIRAEDAGRDKSMRESADVVVSRAVAHLSALCEYCLPLAKIGGAFFAYKTARAEDEIAESKKALYLLGATPEVEVYRPAPGVNGNMEKTSGVRPAPGTNDNTEKTPDARPEPGTNDSTEKTPDVRSADVANNIKEKASGTSPIQNTNHEIFIISKERKTPRTYPRKAGIPAKMPL